MHRRQFLTTATLAAAALPLASLPAHAQPATPDAGDDTLADRVASVSPAALFEALLSTPVTTPLVSRDTPEVEPVLWEAESDTDLDGAVGGVLFQTGWDSYDNPLVMSTAIVLTDGDEAAAAMFGADPSEMQELFGLPFFAEDHGDFAIAVVRVSYLVLAGGAEAPDDPEVFAGQAPMATPVSASGSGRIHLRALANLAATLDHLEDVLVTLDA